MIKKIRQFFCWHDYSWKNVTYAPIDQWYAIQVLECKKCLYEKCTGYFTRAVPIGCGCGCEFKLEDGFY